MFASRVPYWVYLCEVVPPCALEYVLPVFYERTYYSRSFKCLQVWSLEVMILTCDPIVLQFDIMSVATLDGFQKITLLWLFFFCIWKPYLTTDEHSVLHHATLSETCTCALF